MYKRQLLNIKIHAWINTYLIWSSPNPPLDKEHILFKYPEWIDNSNKGNNLDNSTYLSSSHPEVNSYLYNIVKELVENYLRASRKSFLDMGYCFYLFLFRVLQRMIFQFSYPVYRHYLKSTSKEILNNHKEWLHEFEEWDQAPTEGNP